MRTYDLLNSLSSRLLPRSAWHWLTTCALTRGFSRTAVHGGDHCRTIYPAAAIEGDSESQISPKQITLDSLPIEILNNICSNLCTHCRVPHVVDLSPEDVALAHEEQQALSRLSRTSRIFRLTAQPILFHHYHSRTHPHNHVGSCSESSIEVYENENLQSFLRAIIERPDLAEAVKSIAFYTHKTKTCNVSGEAQGIFRQAGINAGFKDLASYARIDVKWMQELAIMLSPFLGELLLHRTSGEGVQFLEHSSQKLSNLKYLVLPGRTSSFDESYHIQEMQDLLVKAENLEVLNASDCDSGTDIPSREFWRWEDWTLQLSNLRRLSLHGLDPDNVAKIVSCCPSLEDFEYFCDIDKYTVLQHDHLETIRSQLKRICYTGITWESTSGNTSQEVVDLTTAFMNWNPSLRPDFSCGHFTKLEILEVEQMLLYGPLFKEPTRSERFETLKESGPEMFMSSIPWSLKVLHIGMVVAWPELHRDLIGMAEKIYRFPDLETIIIDPFDVPRTEEVEQLIETFAQYGIAFQLGWTTQAKFAKGMMGVRPGHSDPLHSGGVTFSLEDPELALRYLVEGSVHRKEVEVEEIIEEIEEVIEVVEDLEVIESHC